MARMPTVFGLLFLLGGVLVWGAAVVAPFGFPRFDGLSSTGWAIYTSQGALVEVGPIVWWRYWVCTRGFMVGIPLLVLGLIGLLVARKPGQDWPRGEKLATWLGVTWGLLCVALLLRGVASLLV